MAHLERESFPEAVKFSKWICGHQCKVLLPIYHKVIIKHDAHIQEMHSLYDNFEKKFIMT
jgi:hypothetical protein